MSGEPVHIVYDGDCPFCSKYVKLVRLRHTVGPVVLVDARGADHPMVDFVRKRGVVLDNEMALVVDGEVCSGADCINRLALMSTNSGTFNRMNSMIFSSPRTSRALYPILRTFRNLTLKLLSRSRITH